MRLKFSYIYYYLPTYAYTHNFRFRRTTLLGYELIQIPHDAFKVLEQAIHSALCRVTQALRTKQYSIRWYLLAGPYSDVFDESTCIKMLSHLTLVAALSCNYVFMPLIVVTMTIQEDMTVKNKFPHLSDCPRVNRVPCDISNSSFKANKYGIRCRKQIRYFYL